MARNIFDETLQYIAQASEGVHRAHSEVNHGGSQPTQSLLAKVSEDVRGLINNGAPITFRDLPACVI
jgi:hypothetical protein